MRTFKKAVVERDAIQLLHSYTFINDLCTDANLRPYVLGYQHFSSALKETYKDVDDLCKSAPDDIGEPENCTDCLRNVLRFLTVLIQLDLYSLRCHHSELAYLCMKASRICLPESLELFAAIVSQYRDEGRLPQELITVISDGLPGLLVPPSLEPGKAGLQWLQVIGALCESSETQERVLLEVTPDSFEDTLYSVLQHTSQNGPMGAESSQQAVVVGCRAALTLAPLSRDWEAALVRMLAHHQVRKLLCSGLSSNNGTRRRQILQLVKHHYFPSDQMNQVFGETMNNMSDVSVELSATSRGDSGCESESTWSMQSVTANQEDAIDRLIAKLNKVLSNNQISDVATSSVMELYGYKMTCLEQRLHSYSVALQGATDHMASLQHTLAMLQATNSSQQDVLYTTQMQNERHKNTIDDLHKQLEDAETTLRGFRAKLAAERMDKEAQKDNLQKEFKAQLANIENEVKAREREAEERMRKAESEYKALQKKLEQQASKNSELAGVLVKFEERVKQRDKKLEEAHNAEIAAKKETEQREATIKQLEKTVLERENRLYQVTTQLEEMKRVQEMVAKLMSKSSTASS